MPGHGRIRKRPGVPPASCGSLDRNSSWRHRRRKLGHRYSSGRTWRHWRWTWAPQAERAFFCAHLDKSSTFAKHITQSPHFREDWNGGKNVRSISRLLQERPHPELRTERWELPSPISLMSSPSPEMDYERAWGWKLQTIKLGLISKLRMGAFSDQILNQLHIFPHFNFHWNAVYCHRFDFKIQW